MPPADFRAAPRTRRPGFKASAAALAVLFGFGLTHGASAQTDPAPPPNPTGTPMTVHGNIEGPNRLAIVQVCEPGGGCQLSFVDTLKQDDVPELVRRARGAGRPGTDPSVTVLALCAANWVASVRVGDASSPSQGMVCGYPTELAALQAAFTACDKQLGRRCAAEPQAQVSWGKWDGRNLPGRDQAPGKLYAVWDQQGAQVCALQQGRAGSCNAAAADTLGKAGILD